MRDEYDFSNGKPNPFTSKYKNEITIKIDDETLSFLKEQAKVQKVPYHSLASMFLGYCAKEHSDLVVAPLIEVNKR